MANYTEALPLLLLQAREATVNYFRPILQEASITEQQWRVVRVLSEHNELESKSLAKLCCILSPSLTGILNRLEKVGYIQRRKSEEDLRCVLISLSPDGQALFQRIRPMLDRHYHEISQSLSEDKLRMLSRLLSELTDTVSELSTPAPKE
ncbi:MAG: homoprotocatechuate degradation operon regulator HpaR [Halopseudomonas sp.]